MYLAKTFDVIMIGTSKSFRSHTVRSTYYTGGGESSFTVERYMQDISWQARDLRTLSVRPTSGLFGSGCAELMELLIQEEQMRLNLFGRASVFCGLVACKSVE